MKLNVEKLEDRLAPTIIVVHGLKIEKPVILQQLVGSDTVEQYFMKFRILPKI